MKSFFISLWSVFFIILLIFFIGCFEGFFYPVKYEEIIKKNSDENGITSALVASIINVESGYDKNSISNKGAIGLMQILPETAQWIAEKKGEEYSYEKLFEEEINISYGCYYISYLIRYFGDQDLAICAYNAGMGNVTKWLKDESLSKDGKLIDIPFPETKNYLQKVQKNIKNYKNRL